MRLRVALHGFPERERDADIGEDASYLDLLSELSIPVDSVLVTAGGEVVPADAPVDPERAIRLVRIVSGG